MAKSRRTARDLRSDLPHLITTSYLTHDAIESFLVQEERNGDSVPPILSPGRSIGLRLVPMARDLRFAWEETLHQVLDEQAQKVLDSLHAALIAWAEGMGEFYGSSYIVNPRGTIEAQAGYDQDELLVHEIDLDMIREVRNTWQFFRDRRPETYGPLSDD